ncbi:MAG: hypothetical protein JNJ52_09305 [Flavobacterium sp.]|nr:hypothetical protein [Flavobacterium sp.]
MKTQIKKQFFVAFLLFATIPLGLIAQGNPKKHNIGVTQLELKSNSLDAKVIDSTSIQLIFPSPYCPTNTKTPTFRWKTLKSKTNKAKLSYDFKLVEMNPNDSTMNDFNQKKVIASIKGIKGDSLVFPNNIPTLEMKKLYGWQIIQYENGIISYASLPLPFYIIDYKFPHAIEEITCCSNNMITNGQFENGLSYGIIGQVGKVEHWELGYGKPLVISSNDGCGNPGYVRLYGNKSSGACISQTLQKTKIKEGKHYRFSACIRLSKVDQNADYAYLKVIAFNGNLPSSLQHPLPSSTNSIMGWSGKILSKDWITFSFDVWTANKDFDKIGIYCCTDSDDVKAVCDIDKICLIETTDERSCDDYTLNENGLPELDSSLTAQAQNQVTTYYEQDNGKLIDLYGYKGYDGTTSFYQMNDDCASIGGQIPQSVVDYNIDEELKELGFEGGIEKLKELVKTEYKDRSKPTKLKPIPPISNGQCKNSYTPNTNLPFSGRDIIFVHGLKLEHLCAKAGGIAGAQKNWPSGKSEFYAGGYYNQIAVLSWQDHIQEWLRSRGYNNRFLIVAYNCSQRADVAAHAILTQIRDAMDHGEGVNFVENDTRKKECFGRDAVIVSHSTGAFIADIAMSLAEKSKHDPIISQRFGNVGFISDNMKLHISLQGSFNGSSLASLYIAAQNNPVLSSISNYFVCKDISGNPFNTRAIALQSILIDLQPSVSSTLWRPFISTSPVSTITVAGGHAHGTYELKPTLNIPLHPGFDDGVLTMGSQSANPYTETPGTPVGFIRNGNIAKLYDMGVAKTSFSRANEYFLNQTCGTLFSPFVAGASTAFLSPTGMVEPVLSIPALSNPENRLSNHYSFLQSSSDHYKGPRGKKQGVPYTHNGEGYDPYNHNGTSGFRYLNYDYSDDSGRHWEESLVITNPAVFSKGFVNPLIINQPIEKTKGEYLDFDVYGPQLSIKCCPLKFKFWWGPMFHVNITIWKRKYHLMSDSETECESGYVYKYILR